MGERLCRVVQRPTESEILDGEIFCTLNVVRVLIEQLRVLQPGRTARRAANLRPEHNDVQEEGAIASTLQAEMAKRSPKEDGKITRALPPAVIIEAIIQGE